MVNISLTDFVDYVSKIGSTKYTHVNKIKNRKGYHPAFDFWKPLRDSIIDLHQKNGDKKELDLLLKTIADGKKLKLYPNLIKQYKTFLGRKKTEWFEPPNKNWIKNDLTVKLNPELGLMINDKPYVIKLYFKNDSLSQTKVDLIILLMNETLRKRKLKDATFAVLDIPNNKLFEKTKLDSSHLSLLEGEALSFINIWDSI